MTKLETTYRSYLLRLWRKNEPQARWQAMLERIPQGDERHYFKDLAALMAFIQRFEQELSTDKEAEL